MVAVDVLPQKGNLFDALLAKPFNFSHDGVQISTSLPASDPGHNAEGAHVIASSHDGQVGRHIIGIFSHWSDIGIGFLYAELDIDALLLRNG